MRDTPHVPLRQHAEEKRRGKELRVVYTLGSLFFYFFGKFFFGKKNTENRVVWVFGTQGRINAKRAGNE